MSKTEVITYPRLGAIRFIVKQDGVIIRTAVSALRENGRCSYLQEALGTAPFLEFDAAAQHAKLVIGELLVSDEITRKREAELREHLTLLGTPEYREEVLQQPLIQESRFGGIKSVPDKVLGADVEFPTDYFLPGSTVYGLVTPLTHYSLSPTWRPRPYFILPVEVREVSYAKAWSEHLYYTFHGTSYRFQQSTLFATEAEARTAMVDLFEKQTGGTILPEKIIVESVLHERDYWKKFDDRMKAERGRSKSR